LRQTGNAYHSQDRWWMLPSDQIRMLPREMPRDPLHGEIVQAALSGQLPFSEIPRFFHIPGIGFHMALYALTMHLIGYRQAGSQTFVVPEGMQEALGRTSLEAVGPWDIKLPYEYLYVALPSCEYEIWGGERTGWHKVGGAFVYLNEEDTPRQVYNPRLGLYESEDSRFNGIPNPGYLNIYLWGMENENSKVPGDDASLYMTINLQEMIALDLDLEEYLRVMLTQKRQTRSAVGGAPSRVFREVSPLGVEFDIFTDLPTDDESRFRLVNNTIHTLRVLFNALLYLGSDGAELEPDEATVQADREREEAAKTLKRLKSGSKRKKVERKLEKLPKERVVWVGRSVPSSKEARESDPNDRGPGRRTWVRGHWWPRKDTIRRRLQASQKAVHSMERDLMENRGGLKDAASPSERATFLAKVMGLEVQVQEAEGHHEALSEELQKKLRWVRPYVRNKDAGETIEGHTYQLGERP
jgi:hypothetical protein